MTTGPLSGTRTGWAGPRYGKGDTVVCRMDQGVQDRIRDRDQVPLGRSVEVRVVGTARVEELVPTLGLLPQ